MAVGVASISGTRFNMDRSKSSFIITPMAFARPAFMPIGKFSAQTLPFSMSHLNEGKGLPYLKSAFAWGS